MSLLCTVHYPARFKEHADCTTRQKTWHNYHVEVGEIGREDKDFPAKLGLEFVKPAVKKIWYRGRWNKEIFTKCAAVVGSRRMSRYGKQAIAEIVPRLCSAGYTIVSGLMYGVDQEAHKLTLDCGGAAIGVLGYGISYKSEQGAMNLAGKIVESGGLILSEYPGEMVCQRWMFPQRNRIVVGLSEMIVIAEAGEKSGSLNTAKWAKKMGKPVYAVPGSVFSPTSEGANWLVSQGMANALTRTVLDKLLASKINNDRLNNSRKKTLTTNEQRLLLLLKLSGPMGVNEVARESKLRIDEVLSILSTLEMEQLLVEESGLWRNP